MTTKNDTKREEELIVEWLENKVTTEEICKELKIGLNKFRYLLNEHRYVIEEYSFKKGEKITNSMLKLAAETTYSEEILKECKKIVRQYENKKILLSDALSKASNLGIRIEHMLALISIETEQPTETLFEILEYEGNLCSELLSRDQIFDELQKLRERRSVTLWGTKVRPKLKGDLFIKNFPLSVISHIRDTLGEDIQIKDTLDDTMKIIVIPSQNPKEDPLPKIFYLDEVEDGILLYSFLSGKRKDNALRKIVEPLRQSGMIIDFWMNPESCLEFAKQISSIDTLRWLKGISRKFDDRIAPDLNLKIGGDNIEFIYDILERKHALPESIAVYSANSPHALFKFTNKGDFSLGRGDFTVMVSKMKDFLSFKVKDREKFKTSAISYRFSKNILDHDFVVIKDIMKRAFVEDSIRKEDKLFPGDIPLKPVRTFFKGIVLHENDEELEGYLFDTVWGYNCKFVLVKEELALLSTIYTNALLFERVYEKIIEHLDEKIEIIQTPVTKDYEVFVQSPLMLLSNYPNISKEGLSNALIEIGIQFASLCYEENRKKLHKGKIEWTRKQFADKINDFAGGQEISHSAKLRMISHLEEQGLFSSQERGLILELVPDLSSIRNYLDKLSNLFQNIDHADKKQMTLGVTSN